MNWFDQLRQALAAYYPAGSDATIVGYLQGSVDPAVWRSMETAQNRNQMLILGSLPPTTAEWQAAGVAQRGQVQTVTTTLMAGFIVLYGGFILRPWGKIFIMDDDARDIGFPAALRSFRANMPRRP